MGGSNGFWHSEPMTNSRRLRQLVVALTFVGGALAGQAGIKSERMLAAIIEHTPAPRLVTEGEQLQFAEKSAAQLPDAQALLGVGSSMEPLYASNTAVVVQSIKYDDLKKGMTVVYIKKNGRRVAHSIVGETHGGFLVQGVNNDDEDAELVTEKNFVGVIVQAFASADTAFRAQIEQRVAQKGKVRNGNRA